MLAPIVAALLMNTRWSPSQADAWAKSQPWRAGCNFTPSTAINQLEMWQAATFDPETIGREFGLMKRTGLSVARIFLHDVAYQEDPKGFKERMGKLLGLADRNGVKVLFTIFDDCWNPHPKAGPQPQPKPGIHNSGWVRSPADECRTAAERPRLRVYVQDVLRTFAHDKRVWMWDLYNEPGNSAYGEKTLPLLREVFTWAREIRPDQPLTAGAYSGGDDPLDRACTDLSDVTTFHCYSGVDELKKQIAFYKGLGRPVVCTEWMARTAGSLIKQNLPVFHEEGVSCLQWGFVSGKTNTVFPWGSKPGSPEPKVWFHDVYRADGTPFDTAEVGLYQQLGLGDAASKALALPKMAKNGGLKGLRLLADMKLRDPSICQGPDGTWYLTGTVQPFFGYNEGIKVWKSKDMRHWESLGYVFKYGKSPWHKPYLAKKMPLWAPEIHYLKGTFWLTYSMPGYDDTAKTSGCGLLKSVSGKAEGPYVDMHPEGRLGDEIDASLFEDSDGQVYFLWHSGKIARMNNDMTGLAEPYHWARTVTGDSDPHHHSGLCERIFGTGSFDHVCYEGVYLFKRGGKYYMSGSEMIDGRYSCMVASSDSIYGPYSARYEAIPYAGHQVFFADEAGGWWSTIFGDADNAPVHQQPAIVPVRFSAEGKVEIDDR